MRILSRLRYVHKPIFSCERCGLCCSNVFPLFRPDLVRLEKRINLSKMRAYIKVYLSQGETPPKGIRLFLDAGKADRDPYERVTCPFLGEGNICSIYEDRPIACRRFPLGTRTGGPCPYWNGHPDDEMLRADEEWKREEKEIRKLGSENYYRRWLNLLYPKGYIPATSLREGVFWTTHSKARG